MKSETIKIGGIYLYVVCSNIYLGKCIDVKFNGMQVFFTSGGYIKSDRVIKTGRTMHTMIEDVSDIINLDVVDLNSDNPFFEPKLPEWEKIVKGFGKANSKILLSDYIPSHLR